MTHIPIRLILMLKVQSNSHSLENILVIKYVIWIICYDFVTNVKYAMYDLLEYILFKCIPIRVYVLYNYIVTFVPNICVSLNVEFQESQQARSVHLSRFFVLLESLVSVTHKNLVRYLCYVKAINASKKPAKII